MEQLLNYVHGELFLWNPNPKAIVVEQKDILHSTNMESTNRHGFDSVRVSATCLDQLDWLYVNYISATSDIKEPETWL